MTKNILFIELRKRLSLLESCEVDKIIAQYESLIDKRVSEGIPETKAVSELGNINELARKILESYKISPRYIKLFIGKEKVIDDMNELVESLGDVSATVYIKIEEAVSELARSTRHLAANVVDKFKNKTHDKK